jgi:integrase/recombinase XerD
VSAALRLVRDSDGGGELPPIDAYEIWLRGRGLSPRTVGEAVHTLRRLEHTTGHPIDQTPTLAISRFLGAEQLSSNSRCSYHSQLAGFFRWWANSGGVDAMTNIPRPRKTRGVPRPITTAQLRSLLALPLQQRTRMMILLAALAGLRVHEIAKVRGQDVDLQARTLYVLGKGGKDATLPLNPLIVAAAEGRWVGHLEAMPYTGWWFPGLDHSQHMHHKSLGNAIKNVMIEAGVRGSAHQLRHYFATELINTGTDLRTTQELMRHSDLGSTAIYTQVTDVRRVEAINRLDPFG